MRYVAMLMIGLQLVSCTRLSAVGPLTWDDERWGQVEQQQLDSSCGLAALLTIMRHHFGDDRFDERALLAAYIEHASTDALERAMRQGVSLLELESLAESLGYKTLRKMFTFQDLERAVSVVPVLVYLEIGGFRHFAVVRGISGETVWLADPSRGNVYQPRLQFLSAWRTPETLRNTWARPGGLILIHPNKVPRPTLLKEPRITFPVSFLELRRSLLINR